MEHPSHLGKFPHDGQTVPVCLSVMEDHRQIQLLCQRHLQPQRLLLHLVRHRILLPVVVQPDLPDGHHLRLLCQHAQLVDGVGGEVFQIGGVEAHCGVDVVIPLRQLHRHLRGGQVTAGIDDQTDAELGQSGQECVPIAVEPAGIIMGMGVEEHRVYHLYHGNL